MIHHGDCIEVMRTMPDASVDAIVTDPPYGLEFMGKEWDRFRVDDPGTNRHRGEHAGKHGEATQGDGTHPARGGVAVAFGGGKRPSTNRCVGCGKRDQFRNPHACPGGTEWRKELIDPHAAPTMLAYQEWSRHWATEALRVAKPGAYLLAFGGTRTSHRLACAIEDAGWEIRDTLVWAYASGFPKSLDVGKAIDKAAGAEREIVGYGRPKRGEPLPALAPSGMNIAGARPKYTAPATDAARQWDGWGTALKPAWEPIVMARKPLRGTVAANVLEYGTGALNIDACRIGTPPPATVQGGQRSRGGLMNQNGGERGTLFESNVGRWPPNLILTDPIFDGGVEGVVGGGTVDTHGGGTSTGIGYGSTASGVAEVPRGDSGTYSRFFLIPKAARSDREPVVRGQLAEKPWRGQNRPEKPTLTYEPTSYGIASGRSADVTYRKPRPVVEQPEPVTPEPLWPEAVS